MRCMLELFYYFGMMTIYILEIILIAIDMNTKREIL